MTVHKNLIIELPDYFKSAVLIYDNDFQR